MFKSLLTSRLFIGVLILSAAVTAGVAAGIYLIPGVDVQLPPPSAYDLTIGGPYEGATIFLYDNVNIRVDTHTSPVPSWVEDKFISDFGNDKYELWVDGTYVTDMEGEAPALDRGRYAYTLWIRWEASTPGMHMLVVRGKNKFWTAVSNVVHVNVVDLVSVSDSSSYLPQNSETLATVAGKFGVLPIALAAANPEIPSLDDPLSPDKPVRIPGTPGLKPIDENPPQDDPPGMYQGGDSALPSPPVSKVALWLGLNAVAPGFLKDGPPAAPTLFRFKEACDVSLYIRDNSTNELGFFLYRLNPGATTFKRIATFGSHSGDKFIEYADKSLYGKYQYYVSAFNAQGESSDTFMYVEFTDSGCLKSENTAYMFSHIVLSLDVSADKVYCYYSQQEGEWSRVPEDPNAFIYPTSNGYDLTRFFSDFVLFPQSELKLDCWGWQGGSLAYLGAFDGKADSIKDNTINLDGELGTITGTLFNWYYPPDFPGYPPPIDWASFVKLPAPYDLRGTNLLDTCHRHFPGISLTEKSDCMEAIAKKYNILVWEWDPVCSGGSGVCETKIDGFKVYRVEETTGSSILVATIPGKWQNVSILPWFFPGERFYVRSYLGDHQSKRSNIYTVTALPEGFKDYAGSPTVKSLKVSTPKYRSTPCEKPLGGLDVGGYFYSALVGFSHNSYSTDCLETSDHFYRGRILFDLSSVSGYISYARLVIAPEETMIDGVADTTTSCAQALNIVNAVSGDEVTAFSPYLGLPKSVKMSWSFTIDVTTAVKDWVYKDKPNLGFLITGQESGFTKEAQSCLSSLGSINLHVVYFLK